MAGRLEPSRRCCCGLLQHPVSLDRTYPVEKNETGFSVGYQERREVTRRGFESDGVVYTRLCQLDRCLNQGCMTWAFHPLWPRTGFINLGTHEQPKITVYIALRQWWAKYFSKVFSKCTTLHYVNVMKNLKKNKIFPENRGAENGLHACELLR